MFFKKRHLNNLNRLRASVRETKELKKAINNILSTVFYCKYDRPILMAATQPFPNEENILDFLKRSATDWNNLRDKLEWTGREKDYLNQEILLSKNKITEKDKEIERLKEIISCVSSRVIEIVETENKQEPNNRGGV